MPKLSQLLFSTSLLESWLKDGLPCRAIPQGNLLPPDAMIYGVYNAHPGILGIVLTSESFPEVGADHNPAYLPVLAAPVFVAAGPPPGVLLPSAN